MAETWPQEVLGLYGPALDATRQAMINASQTAVPVDEVVKAVMHALTADRPKTRYLVGQNIKMAALLGKLMPDRLRDWLIMHQRG